MANDQAEALSDQEVADECLDGEHVEERRLSKRIRVTKKRWSRMKSQRKADKEPLVSLFPVAASYCRLGKLAIVFIVVYREVYGLKMMLGKNT
ncbi:hypothetical protein Tco_0481653 [Tanacetum coccineum]